MQIVFCLQIGEAENTTAYDPYWFQMSILQLFQLLEQSRNQSMRKKCIVGSSGYVEVDQLSIDQWKEQSDMCCSLIVENEQSEDDLYSYLLER